MVINNYLFATKKCHIRTKNLQKLTNKIFFAQNFKTNKINETAIKIQKLSR